jgi:RimJ/RimL family protein N-acetyltransferase
MTATPTSTELSDERLLLRPPTLGDVDAITAACQDPEIPRWIAAIPSPYTVEDARWFVTSLAEPGWASGEDLVWAITDRETDAFFGTVGLHPRLAGVAEVGFWLAPQARGRGIMTDAVELVCAFGFGVQGLQRIEWQAVVGNDASRAVAERTGFVVEATLRQRLQRHDPDHPDRMVAIDAWIGARWPT